MDAGKIIKILLQADPGNAAQVIDQISQRMAKMTELLDKYNKAQKQVSSQAGSGGSALYEMLTGPPPDKTAEQLAATSKRRQQQIADSMKSAYANMYSPPEDITEEQTAAIKQQRQKATVASKKALADALNPTEEEGLVGVQDLPKSVQGSYNRMGRLLRNANMFGTGGAGSGGGNNTDNSAGGLFGMVKNALPTEMGNALESITGLAGKAASGFLRFGFAAAAVSVALKQITSMIEPFIQLNSQFENMQMRFKVLLGDTQKGKAAMAEVKEYADKTPFTLAEAGAAKGRLLSVGLNDVDYLKSAGNMAAANGMPIEEAAGAFARLQSGASGEAMESLRRMNISQSMFEAQGIRFDTSGQPMATPTKMVEALKSISDENFGGMTDELSKKWSGLWTTMEDTVGNAARQMSNGGFTWLKDSISSLNAALSSLIKSERLQEFGNAIGSIFGSIMGILKNFGATLGPVAYLLGVTLVKAFAVLAGVLATAATGFRTVANAIQLVLELVGGGGLKAIEDAKNRQKDIIKDGAIQLKQARAAFAGESYNVEDENETPASNAAAKARNQATMDAIKARKEVAQSIKTIQTAQEAQWAVEKAKGKDAVQIAEAEVNQAQVNLAAIQAKENAEKKALEANGKTYTKSAEMMAAEVTYAKALENMYNAAITKAETLGKFSTQTEKFLAEANAIEARGGDAGVKKYEALKSAAEEYLSGLKEMRSEQAVTNSGIAKDALAAKAAVNRNPSEYQNGVLAIDQQEQIFQVKALQERLEQIQELSQAQNLGARERFTLYEQERQVFGELTNSISTDIADTMAKIEALQGKAISAANSATGILMQMPKGSVNKGYYKEIASQVQNMNLDYNSMNLQNLSGMVGLSNQLKTKGVDVRGMMPSASQVVAALGRELNGIPDTISKLQQGLNDLVSMSLQVGQVAANNFWTPWEARLDLLKAKITELATIDLSPAASTLSTVPIPEPKSSTGNKETNVNVKTDINVQGYTTKDMDDIVTKAKNQFGEDLYNGLLQANTQYGL